jgi:low affinity Fe/Cu permease
METTQENLLGDLESNLVVASTGQRSLNYIIDFVSFIVLMALVIIIIFFCTINCGRFFWYE